MSKQDTKATITAMAESLAKQITIADGKATIAKDAYIGSLPAELTEETLKAVQQHNSNFFPAVTKAFGEAAVAAMAKDKKLDAISLEVPMIDRDHFDLNVQRTRTFPNPKSEGGEPIVKYGVITPQLVTQAARGNRGEMDAVRQDLAQLALAQLGK